MSAIARVTGQVRKIDPRTKKNSAEVFGKEVTVSTEMGDFLGDSLTVMVFNPRQGDPDPLVGVELRAEIDWVVEIESSPYGLRARFRGEASALSALPALSTSGGFGL